MRKFIASIFLNFARLHTRYSPTIRGKQYFPSLARRLCKNLQTKEPFSIWKTREVHRDSFPIKLTYNAMSTVGTGLETRNVWEPKSIDRMITQLRAASGPSGAKTTIFDIGANYGLYSITAACHVPNCHAYAFECSPVPVSILRDNVALNSASIDQSGSSVTVVDRAVSSQCGSSQFLERIDEGHGSLQIADEGTAPTSRGLIDVHTIDGEWMMKNLDFGIIDFCKIDVEGAEQSVISGLKNLLSEKRIKRIQIEVFLKNSAVLDELLNYGYTIVSGDRDFMSTHGMEDFYLIADE